MARLRLSEDQTATLVTLVRNGTTIEVAAGHLGLDPGLFEAWLAKPGQKALREKLARSAAEANLTDTAVIQNEPGWQAARARMEMRQIAERERHLHRLRALTVD